MLAFSTELKNYSLVAKNSCWCWSWPSLFSEIL